MPFLKNALSLKWLFFTGATRYESTPRPNSIILIARSVPQVYVTWVWGIVWHFWPFGLLQTAEKVSRPKLRFCTMYTKLSVAARVFFQMLWFFQDLLRIRGAIDRNFQNLWFLVKIVTFGPEKLKHGFPKKRAGDQFFFHFNSAGLIPLVIPLFKPIFVVGVWKLWSTGHF